MKKNENVTIINYVKKRVCIEKSKFDEIRNVNIDINR